MASKLLQKMIEGAIKQGKKPNYGKMKTDLNKKVREGTATAGEKAALKELGKKDVLATMRQKARQSASSRKKAVSLAGSPKVGGTQKGYGGKMTKKKEGGSMKPKGCGAATRGYGKAMKK